MTDHCIEFIQHALDNGTDMALLYSKKQVTDHLQRVKCKRADIPNPEIPVRINLVFDKMPELIKGRLFKSISSDYENIFFFFLMQC